jgi:hypothetical protein
LLRVLSLQQIGAPHEVALDVTGVRKDLLAMVAAATAAGYGERDLIAVVEYMIERTQKTFPIPAAEN